LKSTDPENKAAADKVVYMAAESLRVCGILLQPFLPDKATQLLDTLGVAQDKRTYAYAVPNCDLSYGTPFIDPGRDRNDGLFPPLVEDKDVDYAGNLKAQRRAAQKRPEKKAPSILHTDN
jgi:methionyl-tRNA synthetase